MICHQNWHKEEDRSNCNELTMLPKAAISVCGIFVKPEKQETPICKHSVLEETPKFKHSALGLKFRFFSGGLPTCPGGRASCHFAGYVPASIPADHAESENSGTTKHREEKSGYSLRRKQISLEIGNRKNNILLDILIFCLDLAYHTVFW